MTPGCSRKARLRRLQHAIHLTCALGAMPACAADPAAPDIADLSLEQLANVIVTSVSRREESLGKAAAELGCWALR